jgi:hypothetical protein
MNRKSDLVGRSFQPFVRSRNEPKEFASTLAVLTLSIHDQRVETGFCELRCSFCRNSRSACRRHLRSSRANRYHLDDPNISK